MPIPCRFDRSFRSWWLLPLYLGGHSSKNLILLVLVQGFPSYFLSFLALVRNIFFFLFVIGYISLRGPPPDPTSSHFAKFRQQAAKFRHFSPNFATFRQNIATFRQISPLFARFRQNFAFFRQISPYFAIGSSYFAKIR